MFNIQMFLKYLLEYFEQSAIILIYFDFKYRIEMETLVRFEPHASCFGLHIYKQIFAPVIKIRDVSDVDGFGVASLDTYYPFFKYF
jgi:hypothetical protein